MVLERERRGEKRHERSKCIIFIFTIKKGKFGGKDGLVKMKKKGRLNE